MTNLISIHAPHAGRDARRENVTRHFAPFQSTRPMRGATNAITIAVRIQDISIHAPHAGRDCGAVLGGIAQRGISIHAPHAGRDSALIPGRLRTRDFNPRAPCGARLVLACRMDRQTGISIHAPHAGRDKEGAP